MHETERGRPSVNERMWLEDLVQLLEERKVQMVSLVVHPART